MTLTATYTQPYRTTEHTQRLMPLACIVDDMAQERGYSPVAIRARRNDPPRCRARRDIGQTLLRKGYTASAIARAMGLDHSTVVRWGK